MFLDDSLVFLRSKKQPTVSGNSFEAEYKSVVDGTCDLIWIHSLFSFLFYIVRHQHQSHCIDTRNAQNALHIASSHVCHERMKYIENDCHLVEERQ